MIWLILIVFSLIAGGSLVYLSLFSNKKSVYERAMEKAHNGDFTDARGLIRSRLDSDNDNPQAHYTMAVIYELENNLPSTLEHLLEVKRINRIFPGLNKAELLNKIATIYYKTERYQGAFENYFESARLSMDNEEALAHLAFMAAGQEEFELAEKYFAPLVKISPRVAEYRLARAVCLSLLKKKEAVEEFKEALKLNPTDTTTKFLTALQSYFQKEYSEASELLETIPSRESEPYILFIIYRLLTAVYYEMEQYDLALKNADLSLSIAIAEQWEKEEYDSRISVANMALLCTNYEKANENLLELEVRYPTDEMVINLADFRMDLEEGITRIDQVSPRGFDFAHHLRDWLRKRFQKEAMFKLSGLKMDSEIDLMAFTGQGGAEYKPSAKTADVDWNSLIAEFNTLGDNSFYETCSSIMRELNFTTNKTLPYRDRDGADLIGTNIEDKKIKALFRFRKWKDQPISDIFLRDMQNYMNELKVNMGFVIAGARLTTGAEQALQNLKKIQVINENDFGKILQNVLKP